MTTENTEAAIAPKLPSQDEIVARIKECLKTDIFGAESEDYIERLDYEHAFALFGQKDMTREDWAKESRPHTRKDVIKSIRKYMSFAREKAKDQRGLSAYRSLRHFVAWSWLAGDLEFSRELHEDSCGYTGYGLDVLKKICKYYRIPWKKA